MKFSNDVQGPPNAISATALDIPFEIWIKVLDALHRFTPCEHWFVPEYDGKCSIPGCYNWTEDGFRRILPTMKTCKFLWAAGEPLLYRAIQGTKILHPSFVRQVKERTKFLVNTRYLAYTPAEHAYLPPLFQLRNLTSLSLWHMPTVHDEIALSLLEIPQLRRLQIDLESRRGWDEPWVHSFPESWSNGRFGPQLEYLKISGLSESNQWWLELFSQTLKELEIHHHSTLLDPLMNGLRLGTVSLPNVTTLKVFCDQSSAYAAAHGRAPVELLKDFLPKLTRLWATVTSLLPKDLSALSKLEYLGAQEYDTNIILPCQLRELQVSAGGLQRLPESMFPFRSITYLHAVQVPAARLLKVAAQRFPNVEVLTALRDDDLNNIVVLERALAMLPKLRRIWTPYIGFALLDAKTRALPSELASLEWGVVPKSLEAQREMLTRLRKKTCKQLELVRISLGYAWVYDEKKDEWRASLRPLVHGLYYGITPMFPEQWDA